MDLQTAIQTRRTIGKMTSEPVSKEDIQKVLEAATFAPSHYITEPWRFFVLSGEGRNQLGDVLAEITLQTNDEDAANKAERMRMKPLRSPVIIAVAVEPNQENDRVIEKEEFAAVSAAIQNMLLTATSLGLASVWRTGKICYDRAVSDFFELSEKGEVVGMIYLGYASSEPKNIVRTPASALTTWIE